MRRQRLVQGLFWETYFQRFTPPLDLLKLLHLYTQAGGRYYNVCRTLQRHCYDTE